MKQLVRYLLVPALTLAFSQSLEGADTPPVITLAPQSKTVDECKGGVFSVQASGTPPLSFRWHFGATPIEGATGSNYTLAVVRMADSGEYSVVVSNAYGSVTSPSATLAVIADTTPPTVLSVTPDCVSHKVCLAFSEPVDPVSGADSGNYSIDNGVTVNSAVVGPPDTACLWTTPLVSGVTYTLTINGVRDLCAGNGVAANTQVMFTCPSNHVPPVIVQQPASLTVTQSQSATFTATATGTPTPACQWYYNGGAIAGTGAPSYTLANAQPINSGAYTVVASNSSGSATSQVAWLVVTEDCLSDSIAGLAAARDPTYAQRLQDTLAQIHDYLNSTGRLAAPKELALTANNKCIPVVVHIIHDNGPENILDAQVSDAIQQLNEDFRKLPLTPGYGNGVDTLIQFELAKLDPNGNPTTGILHVPSTSGNTYSPETICVFDGGGPGESAMKGLSRWPNDRYLNIWIVRCVLGALPVTCEYAANVYGWAWLPTWVAGTWPKYDQLDGIVVRYDKLGLTGAAAGNVTRTLTHEAGHWAGLFHTFNSPWGSGCVGTPADCATTVDMVCDTPPMLKHWSCDPTSNTCHNDIPDVEDPIHNYVSYSHGCQNEYTDGQAQRMHAVLDLLRPAIWSSANTLAAGVTCPCDYLPRPSGLTAWWPFDEATGPTADDIAGFNNQGTYQGSPTPTAGRVANALCFDGVDDYVLVADHPEINFRGSCASGAECFTIDAWILARANGPDRQILLDKRININTAPQGYNLYLYDGRLGFQIADGTWHNYTCPDPDLRDDFWHFITVTVDRCGGGGNEITLYVDGLVKLSAADALTGNLENTADLAIGRPDPYYGFSYYSGCLDELEFFKRVLPEQEIQAIYNADSAGKCKTNCCVNRTYTTTADFGEGVLMNLVNNKTEYPDQLSFPDHITPFPYVNVACSMRGTLVRIDAFYGAIVGEYYTAPVGSYSTCYSSHNDDSTSPSRVAVDLDGNAWVANRPSNAGGHGTVTRIALIIGGTRGDRIGTPCNYQFKANPYGQYLQPPFIYNSGAQDRDHDGLIRTSCGRLVTGDPDLPAWSGPESGNGDVAYAEDECIINYTQLDAIGPRTVAVDRNNDVWVGGLGANLNARIHQKLAGDTGERLASPPLFDSYPAGGYGGFIDGNNVLWSSGSPNLGVSELLWVNLDSSSLNPLPKGYSQGNYGLAIDPCSGYVWHTTAIDDPNLYVWRPNGSCATPAGISQMTPRTGTRVYAQGIAVDDSRNVWIAHGHGGYYGLPNSHRTVAHLKIKSGFPYEANTISGNSINPSCVDLPQDLLNLPPTGYGRWGGHGPTGVAVDAYQNVWVFCEDSDRVMRINTLMGNYDNNLDVQCNLGQVDKVVDLAWPGQSPNVPNPNNAAPNNAAPYNYSDNTGYIAIGTTCPSGFWDVVHDGGCEGVDWGRFCWHVSPNANWTFTVQVRAADKIVDLPTKPWTSIAMGQNNMPFCGSGVTGRYIEIKVRLFKPYSQPCLFQDAHFLDFSVECCPLSSSITNPTVAANWPPPIKICDPAPFTATLSPVVVQPGGLPLQATFSVNGSLALTTNLPGGPAPTRTVVPFTHTYPPGSNFVEMVFADGTNVSLTHLTPVEIGDLRAPRWINALGRRTNAFTGAVPLFAPELVDDCASPGQIMVTQQLSPGTVLTQGTHLVTLVASDPAGNRTTNVTVFTVGPVLSITSPQNYPQNYGGFLSTTGLPVTVQIAANVTDVIRVNYYLDDSLVATATTAPFSVTLTNVPIGNHSLMAEAVNPSGLTSRSSSVSVACAAPQPVRLQFGRTTNQVILSWPAGWILQRAADVLGPWEDLLVTSPYEVNFDLAPKRYFRVRQ